MNAEKTLSKLHVWYLKHLNHLQWRWYETVIMRFYFAVDSGKKAVAFDQEASLHYQTHPTRLWTARCYVRGFLSGMFVADLPEWFIDSWFQ